MSVTGLARQPSLRGRVSESEWQARVDLAACYRLTAYYGMTDLTATHISVRLPDQDDAFLINPHGLFFDEITASSLVKVDLDGRLLSDSDYPINQAGFTIHSAIHAARHDVACVLHTHTVAGMAVSGLACGLLPLNQTALRFYEVIAYHDYEGIALDLDERARLVGDLGDHRAMILRNHGLLTAGRSIAEAFSLMHDLEKACRTQLDAMASGADLVLPPPEVCRHTRQQFESFGPLGERDWKGHLRRLDRLDPSYRE